MCCIREYGNKCIDKSYHNIRGYRRIYFNSKVYLVHRLVFYYHHGYFPKVVDHIDGNVLNNKIENLQGCTQVENIAKARKFKNNTSGFTGVCYNKAAKKYESYFWKNYKKVYCGLWATAEEAYKAREEKKCGKL